jgi:hypothetical protein
MLFIITASVQTQFRGPWRLLADLNRMLSTGGRMDRLHGETMIGAHRRIDSGRMPSKIAWRAIASSRIDCRSNIFMEHDLVGKPVSTFPDHAL